MESIQYDKEQSSGNKTDNSGWNGMQQRITVAAQHVVVGRMVVAKEQEVTTVINNVREQTENNRVWHLAISVWSPQKAVASRLFVE